MHFSLIGFVVFAKLVLASVPVALEASKLTMPMIDRESSAKDVLVVSPLKAKIAQLEEQARAIAEEREMIIAKSEAEIEAKEKDRREMLQAIDARADADYYRESTREDHPDVFGTDISPLESLYRFATVELKKCDHEEVSWLTNLWDSWYLKSSPKSRYDTRTKPERLFAYAIARKEGKIALTPDVVEFEELFAASLHSWFKDGTYQ